MPRQKSLANLTVDALLKLKSDVESALSTRAEEMRHHLALLTGMGGKRPGRKPGKATTKVKPHPLAGRKAPVKYRDKAGNTWAGRGQRPVWLREALASGAKIEDFAVGKRGRKPKTATA